MSTERNYKRKRFFNYSVKRKLQFRMLFKVWEILFVSLLFVAIIFYYYSNINVGASYRLFHVKATNFLDFLFPALVCGFFASLFLGAVATLFFPHAFAGPLHRIEEQLSEVGKGNLPKEIKLRKGDEIGDLADTINVMLAALKNQIKKIDSVSDEIGDLVKNASSENADETLEKLKLANADLQEAIKRFRL